MILLLLAGCAGLFDAGLIDQTCEDLPLGCDGGGDGGADTGPDVEIAVTSLEPVYGLTDGGTSVSISGGPFAADAIVTFGDADARLRSWTETELLVEAPPVSSDGWVSVSVQTSQGAGSADRAYRYFDDGTDRTGLVGFVQFRHPVGTLASQGDKASATLQFLEPENDDGWWATYASGLGSCHRDYNPSLGWEPIDPGADTLVIKGPAGASVALAWDSAEQAYNGVDGSGDVPADTVEPGTSWSIEAFGGTELPEFALDDLVTVPEPFTLSSPAITGSTTAVLTPEDLDFRWDGAGTADAVFLDLTLANASTGEQVQRVTCVVEDTGTYSLASGAFDEWAAGMVLYIKVGKAVEARGVLPLDGSDVRVLGAYTISGAATTDT